MALTVDQSKYFDDLGEVFGTVGWKSILSELQAEIYQIQADSLEAPTWEDVLKLRGRAEAWAYLLNLETITDYTKSQLEDTEANDGSPSI